MADDVNYKGWAVDLCSLLDAIEEALREDDIPRARAYVAGRHQIAEAHGLEIVLMGTQTAGLQ